MTEQDIRKIITELRARVVAVPKPGTQPRTLGPGDWMNCLVGGSPKPGDDAGECQLHDYPPAYASGLYASGVMPPQPMRVQPHIYVTEPLCERAGHGARASALRPEVLQMSDQYINWGLDRADKICLWVSGGTIVLCLLLLAVLLVGG